VWYSNCSYTKPRKRQNWSEVNQESKMLTLGGESREAEEGLMLEIGNLLRILFQSKALMENYL